MAVNALELRPRHAIALFDSAIRVCATSTGVWALTLPAGAALIAALFNLAEAVRRHQTLVLPAALFTAAWAVRAVSQGAACSYLEQQILGTNGALSPQRRPSPGPAAAGEAGGRPGASEPSARSALRRALARAPGLITASMAMLVLNGALLLFTGGIGFLFFGAHAAGYAAVMRGEGSALNVYGTAARLLGPARSTATWVRLCGLTQVLLALNLHVAAVLGLYLTRTVLGLDVTFLERFVSFDNPLWLTTVAVTTFAIFEPLRAATGTLLLIDGRVRQEGLDLLAAAEQLPRRARRVPALLGALALLLGVAGPARAESSLSARLQHLRASCQMKSVAAADLRALQAVPPADQAALSRFVARLEATAYDDEDCELAEADLRAGLEAAGPPAVQDAALDPAALARDTLARPEFAQTAARDDAQPPSEGQAPGAFSSWWHDLWKKLFAWLKDEKDQPARTAPVDLPSPMLGANLVMVVVIATVLGLLAWILLRGRSARTADGQLDQTGALTEAALSVDPASALFRPAESWAGLADQLAAQGDFREAIRHLYLALLARLHRDGAIDYDPTRSNWEYLSSFRGLDEHKGALRELTRGFDFAWYGNLEVGAPAWGTFRRVARPLLAPTAPEV